MILLGFLVLIIVAVLSQIVLFKGTNFLGMIEQKYHEGKQSDLMTAEEVKNRIMNTSPEIVKEAKVNSSGQIEVKTNAGTHLFYIENGLIKCELIKYGFKISRIGRFLAWLNIVPKMKMANEIDVIYKNLSGKGEMGEENERIIQSVSSKSRLTNILAVLSIVLIIFSVISSPQKSETSNNLDVYINTIQETQLADSEYTYREVFTDFFSNPTWEHFTTEEGEEVVEFTGECTYDEKEVKIKIQYLITNETQTALEWELSYFDIDGIPQEFYMFDGMIEAAIESYQK